jgi:hypothetical protein
MFGHLKAEDFMNLVEGSPLAQRRRIHLESCARCAATLKSVEGIRNQVTAMQMSAEEHIPEPDWAEFRGDVRNALLSRSVKRESTHRNWLGGTGWKPAAAWGFSMVLVFGLMTGAVLWNQDSIEPAVTQVVPVEETMGTSGTIDAIAGMGQADVFDDLIRLDEGEAESLRLLLEDLTRKSGNAQ